MLDGSYVDDDQEELMTFVLTEDIFVEILANRLQVSQSIDGDFTGNFHFS